jgi:hypothetical protein
MNLAQVQHQVLFVWSLKYFGSQSSGTHQLSRIIPHCNLAHNEIDPSSTMETGHSRIRFSIIRFICWNVCETSSNSRRPNCCLLKYGVSFTWGVIGLRRTIAHFFEYANTLSKQYTPTIWSFRELTKGTSSASNWGQSSPKKAAHHPSRNSSSHSSEENTTCRFPIHWIKQATESSSSSSKPQWKPTEVREHIKRARQLRVASVYGYNAQNIVTGGRNCDKRIRRILNFIKDNDPNESHRGEKS